MRRLHHILLALIVALAVVPAVPAGASAITVSRAAPPSASATEIIVKPTSAGAALELQAMLRRDGARVLERSHDGEAMLVEVPTGRGSKEYARAVADAVELTVAEPLGRVTASEVPGDPSYSLQWGLPAIGAPAAWELGWGSSSVVIAVVDSGVDLDHPDLVDQIAPGGRDFVDGDSVPDDVFGHGTHVAGIAAAEANNGSIGSGTAPGSRILPVRVLDADGKGDTWGTAQGIEWAVDHGADIINLSLGTADPSSYLSDAVAYAIAQGVVVVAASGNSNPERLPDVQYPAREPGVIAVGAVQNTVPYTVASFSQDGAGLDLVAPGISIYSTTIGGGGGYMHGTSMATPFVAGTVALMKSRDPALTPAEVASILAATAADLGTAGRDNTYGYGLVRAGAAVDSVEPALNTAMAIDRSPGSTGWYRVAPQITLTPDAPSVTYYRWDAGATQVYASPLVAAEGVHTLTYWSEASAVLEPPSSAEFRVDTQAPAVAAITRATARGSVSADVAWTASADAGSGMSGYVVRTVPGGVVLTTTTSTSALITGLTPGTSYTIEVVASDVAGNTATSASAGFTTVPASALQAVHRFYNPAAGTHFFTASAEERDMVIATWPHLYVYEGVAYSTYPANNTQPLLRFYNRVSKSHFYTASPGEAGVVIAAMADVFSYDGETYRVSTAAAADKSPVYRFYNVRTGSHFYTASVTERDSVLASLSGTYAYEGIGFWLGQ